MLLRSVSNDMGYISSTCRKLYSRFSSQYVITIDEFDGFSVNQIFEAAEIYLDARSSSSTKRVRVRKAEKDDDITVTMERDEVVSDNFDGIRLKWTLNCRESENQILFSPSDLNSSLRSQVRYFQLSFHKKHKHKVFEFYLPYVLKRAKAIREEKKVLKLYTVRSENMYTNLGSVWSSINLDHPATFQTLALDPELKRLIIADLDRFVERRDFYRSVGKAWKRGYLLYGPPGTGKSSLVAAIANYLNFNIYDLELSDLRCNSEFRRLLATTATRSILVIEDIHCTIDMQDPHNKMTLSGLLNFIDGLWSSCVDERLIIFTTNDKDRLDPALQRPGRMDMHIHLSYCTATVFQALASKYLGIQEHPCFEQIEVLIQEVNITPAEVAGELMRHNDTEDALRGLTQFLRVRKNETSS
ncbi:protein HYPER-SENSITIVITY-RELATED 4-like [Aristolochia californica]|uniref:protein HYPER-SENSITIVITY-RELATED 4-like n=1 Tax=Aristolochia californica TaxID=171875 RepID=UPI0035DE20B5